MCTARRTSAILAIGLSVFALASAVPPAMAQEDTVTEAISLFARACLQTAPSFEGAQAVLEDAGFSVYPFGEGEYEFGRDGGDVYGQVATNPDYPGCTVMTEGLSEAGAADLTADLLIDTFGVTLEPWDYDGAPAGWRMPLGDGVLYIVFNDGGISAGMRAQGED